MRWLLVILLLVSLSRGTLKSTCVQCMYHQYCVGEAGMVVGRTRMRTRLPFTSMSEMESLLERDMVAVVLYVLSAQV